MWGFEISQRKSQYFIFTNSMASSTSCFTTDFLNSPSSFNPSFLSMKQDIIKQSPIGTPSQFTSQSSSRSFFVLVTFFGSYLDILVWILSLKVNREISLFLLYLMYLGIRESLWADMGILWFLSSWKVVAYLERAQMVLLMAPVTNHSRALIVNEGSTITIFFRFTKYFRGRVLKMFLKVEQLLYPQQVLKYTMLYGWNSLTQPDIYLLSNLSSMNFIRCMYSLSTPFLLLGCSLPNTNSTECSSSSLPAQTISLGLISDRSEYSARCRICLYLLSASTISSRKDGLEAYLCSSSSR